MWKQRAVTLCGCLAALPLLVGCANRVGGPPQAYALPTPAAMGVPNPGQTQVYTVGPGEPAAVLVVLPGARDMLTSNPQMWASQGFDVVTPSPAEMYQIAANQEAAMARLIAEAQQMANAPVWVVGPNPAIEAAIEGMLPVGPARVSGVVVTSMSSGSGICSERMTYSYSGNGTPPKVSVKKSGDCPAGSPFGSIGTGTNSTVAPPPPAIRPNAPRLIETSAPNGPGSAATVEQLAELIKSASAN